MKKAGLITSSMRVRREVGFILPTTIGLGIVVLVLSSTALVLGSINQRNSSTALRISQAQYAAEAGLEQAQLMIWTKVWAGSGPGTRAAYSTKLESNTYESGSFAKANAGTNVSYPSSGPDYALDNGASYSFVINRRLVVVGNPNIIFNVTSTGKMPDGTIRILNQVFQASPQSFGGLQYAILSNNINCIFCHTKVQDMKALGGPASSTNIIDRVKVGTLEQLDLDDTNGSAVHTADTVIAGSLHVRGNVNGALASSDPTTLATSTMKTLMDDKTDGINSNTTKSFASSDCTTLANCTPANATDKRSLYRNYPTALQANQQWPDGELPDAFPPPIADDGAGTGSVANNKKIDDGEWDAQVDFSNTGMDDQNPIGSITGGTKNANLANALSGGNWPGSENTPTISSTKTAVSQNLVLDGTNSTLTINGTVYVNGDVIIRGKIKGKGKIVARGNIYQLGDVTYDCTGLNSAKVAGQPDCDYTKNGPSDDLPQLGLVAGKNILAGDFMTVRGQDFKSIARANETVELGARELYAAGNAYQQKIPTQSRPSFTYREMGIFNRNELIKYQKNNTYNPRFYRMNDTSPVVLSSTSGGADAYNSNVYTEYFPETNKARISTSTASVWDPGANPASNLRDYNSTDIQNLNSGTNPKVQDVLALIRNSNTIKMALVPSWVSAGDLKKAWINSRECASCAKGALRTDGLLYSGNATFAVARLKPAGGYNIDTDTSDASKSNLNGSWDLRGSLVTADLGALVTGQNLTNASDKLTSQWGTANQSNANNGLSVYYDARMKSFFGQTTAAAKLIRNNWVIGSKE